MRTLGLVVIGGSLLIGRLSSAAPMYSITSLGAGNAIAINDGGQVLGTDNRGSYLYLNGAKQYFPQPTGGSFFPQALNNLGQVAGYVNLPTQYSYTLATYQGGALTITGLAGLSPTAINDAGQILGDEVFTYQGFLYSNGTVTTIGPLPRRVNAAGMAVGFTLENNRRAFVYADAQVSYLSPPGAVSAEGAAINDKGEVVGSYAVSSSPLSRVFIYTDGSYTEFGSALNAGIESDFPNAVNNTGLIVGASETGSGGLAWTYDPAFGFSNLNSAVNAPGWVLQSATDVNERGQIIGTGTLNGQQTGFLLTPIPEPRQWALVLIGFAALLLKLRKTARSKESKPSD